MTQERTRSATVDLRTRVLRAVTFAAAPLTTDEVVVVTGATRSDVAPLLRSLVDAGLLDRDRLGRHEPGWLLHGLGPDGAASIEHSELALDEGFAAFCSERLTEEVVAATLRRLHEDPDAVDGAARVRAEAGLRLLDELLQDLARGVLPDDVTLQLLTTAYAAHPDFDPRWGRPGALVRRTGPRHRDASARRRQETDPRGC